jgi:hypothetical protein
VLSRAKETILVRPSSFLFLCLLLLACHRSYVNAQEKSFDEICGMVDGKTAAEIEGLLGSPDTRQEVLVGDERWIWWSYTFLDGKDYAPEVRGQVVHLEITFRNPSPPGGPRLPYDKWRIISSYGVSYSGLPLPGTTVPSKQVPSNWVYPYEASASERRSPQ